MDGRSVLVNHARQRQREGGIYVVGTADGLIVRHASEGADGCCRSLKK